MNPLDVGTFIGTYGDALSWIGGSIVAGSVFYGMFLSWKVIKQSMSKYK